MKTYLSVTVSANEAQRELLLPTMIELGFEGFHETDTDLVSYIDKSEWNPEKEARLKTDLRTLLQTISSNAEIKISEVSDRNWNEEWERTIQPIEIGERFVIKPSWSDYRNASRRIVLEIDPKMSFGTGYHETTRLVLCLLEKYLKPGDRVFDVGTGTGVLAIAAVKLGAANALGNDIDEWSIENAQENVSRNGTGATVRITDSPVESIHETFSLITSNLTLNTNAAYLPEYRRLLPDGGIILLSGLLDKDEREITEALKQYSFELLELNRENEWIAIAARKS